MNTHASPDQGKDNDNFEATADGASDSALDRDVNEIRLACTSGSIIPVISGADQYPHGTLDEMGATGMLLHPHAAKGDVESLVQGASRVLFVKFNPLDPERYKQYCFQYCKHHGNNRATDEMPNLGGPGMITILGGVDDIDEYQSFADTFADGIRVAIKNSNQLRQNCLNTLSQPTVVCIRNTQTELTDSLRGFVETGVVHGFLFRQPAELETFRNRWLHLPGNGPEDLGIDDLEHCEGPPPREPHLMLQGTAQEILEFISQGKECDGYIVTSALDVPFAQHIQDMRIEKIAERHSSPFAVEEQVEGYLHVGILNLQGAGRWEASRLERILMHAHLKIQVLLIHTAAEMEGLDGVAAPGGWHQFQLKMYRDPRLRVIEGMQEHTTQGRHLLASCAGAIALRHPKKQSIGVSALEPAGLLDTGIHNNLINGKQPIRVKKNAHWHVTDGRFVGAPAFINKGPDVQEIGVLDNPDDTVIAIEQVDPSGAVKIGTSAHNDLFWLRWIAHMDRDRIQRLIDETEH